MRDLREAERSRHLLMVDAEVRALRTKLNQCTRNYSCLRQHNHAGDCIFTRAELEALALREEVETRTQYEAVGLGHPEQPPEYVPVPHQREE